MFRLKLDLTARTANCLQDYQVIFAKEKRHRGFLVAIPSIVRQLELVLYLGIGIGPLIRINSNPKAWRGKVLEIVFLQGNPFKVPLISLNLLLNSGGGSIIDCTKIHYHLQIEKLESCQDHAQLLYIYEYIHIHIFIYIYYILYTYSQSSLYHTLQTVKPDLFANKLEGMNCCMQCFCSALLATDCELSCGLARAVFF